MNNRKLANKLDQFLEIHQFKDYCPNGLQIEGKEQVKKIVTGVTANQALIDAAIELNADAILVHHGYFWKGEAQQIVGMKYNRIKALIKNDINLYAYHLPLDVHPELGNNKQLAKLLGITDRRPLEPWDKRSVGRVGKFEQAITPQALSETITQQLDREPLWIDGGKPEIKTIAWCTGGGQDYITIAAEQGIDAFISGEISERTVHIAKEMGIHYFAAGHHATERYGAKALGEWLANEMGFEVTFIDIDNPV
ncbi:Nif3-like dinuclear metal center hexameric protein [Psychromonas sp. 14N.309.X.WAT.B.A12]|uniref:Nif3-like dinuclear metal center hexameric protein n=1 Tax=unclassified Psychromonas TaxID=2614957 RepID=UPI0025B19094|nr:Nif3-like dinuclear metal center hexameric protein [Psychromonas sp. 14N.309.X.WAT.B.A12]MDN2663096.1 Nif3-like dinuclear metal center hexameric protein [Psychromonas sp. 14N.309.X.WAT.B.A12]